MLPQHMTWERMPSHICCPMDLVVEGIPLGLNSPLGMRDVGGESSSMV
jgi:hypothetical protein